MTLTTRLLGVRIMTNERIIQEAEYADIIITLLNFPYGISSVTKLVFFAFCIKHEQNTGAYGKRTKDFVDTFFNNISVKLSTHYADIETIIHFIDMLNQTAIINVDGDSITVNKEIAHFPENKFLRACVNRSPNPIIEINKLDAKAMLEEVIRYV